MGDIEGKGVKMLMGILIALIITISVILITMWLINKVRKEEW